LRNLGRRGIVEPRPYRPFLRLFSRVHRFLSPYRRCCQYPAHCDRHANESNRFQIPPTSLLGRTPPRSAALFRQFLQQSQLDCLSRCLDARQWQKTVGVEPVCGNVNLMFSAGPSAVVSAACARGSFAMRREYRAKTPSAHFRERQGPSAFPSH